WKLERCYLMKYAQFIAFFKITTDRILQFLSGGKVRWVLRLCARAILIPAETQSGKSRIQ
ncbi:MAG: hypothetical protein LBF66_01940, partial [Holosporales bacterium]|nr:hypothetical protein [Holosporales bacterium]